MSIVLVVDDEPAFRDVVRMHLALDGHRVIEAVGGMFLLAGFWTAAMGALIAIDVFWMAFSFIKMMVVFISALDLPTPCGISICLQMGYLH